MASLKQRFRTLRAALPAINLVEIGLLILLGYALFQFSKFGFQILSFPYPVDYGEGPLLSQVGRLASFENIYTANLSQSPYTITNYPPIYMLIQVPLNWLFGPTFWYGRLLSLISMGGTAVFITLTLKTLTHDWLAALIGGLLLFAIPYVKAWAPLYRIDPLALGLSWSALYLLIRDQSNRRSLLMVAVLLTAAIFTRQSYGLAAPLAAFTWLLSQQPRRRALILAAYVIGLGLGLFILLNLLTSGGFFFNIITANINQFQVTILLTYVRRIIQELPVLIVIGGLFLVMGWFRNRAWWFAGPYLLGALGSAVTIGKIGSNVNYLLELSASLCLIMGLAIAWLRHKQRLATRIPSKAGWQLASILMTVILAAQVYWATNVDNGYDRYLLQKTGLRTQNEILLGLIEQTDGLILTGEHMGLLALTGRPISYQPFEMKQLSDSGVWDQTPFLTELENGKYPLILMYRPMGANVHERRWTPEMLALITARYRYVNNFDQTIVYEWKK
jgi:hypothetical protein